MKITDKITNEEVEIEKPKTIEQMQKWFGCEEECNNCPEAFKLEAWKENSEKIRVKLCQLLFTK